MELTGVIQRIIFRNADNGWTVMELQDASGDEITVVGVLAPCHPGEEVVLEGDYTQHRVYGLQFKATTCRTLAPASLRALETYLSSGLIKGVGEVTAKRIVARFGMDTLDILENQPERLCEVEGIGRTRAAAIASSFFEQRATRDTMMGLQMLGLTVSQATQLFKLHGPLSLSRVEEDPYRLIDEIDGIGFPTADRIAQNTGIEPDSPRRMEAGLRYVLLWAYREGHTYLPRELLIDTAVKILQTDMDLLEDNLDQLMMDQKIFCRLIEDQQAMFLPFLYEMEMSVAHRLLQLSRTKQESGFFAIGREIDDLEREFGMELAPQQRQAAMAALDESATVITGGPGTGKTTIIRFIIHVFDRMGLDYALCAPTGRAAKRMSETTDREASTIHRLLEYNPGEGFHKNADNPLFYDAVIVDEMSMVDLSLMHALLKALPTGTRLIMVGDADQLPPVGAGNVLKDIIDSDTISVIRLTEIFRQASKSLIITNAHRINSGEMPVLDQQESDFSFYEIPVQERVLDALIRLLHNPGFLGVSDALSDIQVLSPMKKGVLGVNNLNIQLQQALNPPSPGVAQYTFGSTTFRVGDKVMQTKNDYRLEWTRQMPGIYETGVGVFNGDLGTIYRMSPQERWLEVLFDDGRLAIYEFNQLEELELAYCISVHKSQGSEFPVMLLPLAGGPPMLMTRNLLYTAVTRARTQVCILGRQQSIAQMVENVQTRKRYSALDQILQEYGQWI